MIVFNEHGSKILIVKLGLVTEYVGLYPSLKDAFIARLYVPTRAKLFV